MGTGLETSRFILCNSDLQATTLQAIRNIIVRGSTVNSTLSEIRQHKGLTIAEVAKALRTKPETLKKWEDRATHPSIERAIQISRYYQVSIDKIIW